MEFKCSRCGKCCIKDKDNLDFWETGRFTEEQKAEMLLEIKKHKPVENGCRMLFYEGDVASCMVEVVAGKKAKPKICEDYPHHGDSCKGKELREVNQNDN